MLNSTFGWMRAAAVTLSAGALVAAGSGIATADPEASDLSTPTRTSAAHKSAPRGSSPVSNRVAAPKPAASVAPPAALRIALPSAAKAKAGSKGPFLGLIGNGTAEHPDAGKLAGYGFSWDRSTCPAGKVCNGGNAGLFFGNGGNGYNGGNGGNAGMFGLGLPSIWFPVPAIFFASGGFGGDASDGCVAEGITCNGGAGGNASKLSLIGLGGAGGNGNSMAGGKGGKGGSGGLIGIAGRDGNP